MYSFAVEDKDMHKSEEFFEKIGKTYKSERIIG